MCCSPEQGWGDSQAVRCKRTREDDFYIGSKAAQAPRLKQLLPLAQPRNGLGHLNNEPGREEGLERQIHSVCCLQGSSITACGALSSLSHPGEDGGCP